MDRNALFELELLKQVAASPRLNNRLAARKLGVSVKLAHALLARMVGKGLLHVRKEHARRWDYFLTPRGLTEKSRLTFEFLEFSFQFYHEARKRSAQLCRDLHEAGVERVGFVGAGELAEIAYLGVVEWQLQLVAVFDDERAGSRFMELTVQPLAGLTQSQIGNQKSKIDRLIVCLFSKEHPMTPDWLPPGLPRDKRMAWIFHDR